MKELRQKYLKLEIKAVGMMKYHPRKSLRTKKGIFYLDS